MSKRDSMMRRAAAAAGTAKSGGGAVTAQVKEELMLCGDKRRGAGTAGMGCEGQRAVPDDGDSGGLGAGARCEG